MRWRAAVFLVLLPLSHAIAQVPVQAPIILNENRPRECLVTPTLAGAAGSYPGRERIVHSNKLAMAAGKAVFARGEILFLQGRVYDEHCVPLEGASLELWQADTRGKFKWQKPGRLNSPMPAFAGTGQAFTNNLGEYQFLTVFPGAYADRAPHISLRITHPDFEVLTTEVFFADDQRNDDDGKLKLLNAAERRRVMAQMTLPNPAMGLQYLTARLDIVLKGEVKFKRY